MSFLGKFLQLFAEVCDIHFVEKMDFFFSSDYSENSNDKFHTHENSFPVKLNLHFESKNAAVFLLSLLPPAPRVVAAVAAPPSCIRCRCRACGLHRFPSRACRLPSPPDLRVAALAFGGSLPPLISVRPPKKPPGVFFRGHEKKEGFPSLDLLCLHFFFFLDSCLHVFDRGVFGILDDLHGLRSKRSRLWGERAQRSI